MADKDRKARSGNPESSDKQKQQQKQALYAELLKYCQNKDYEKAIKIANRIVHESPWDSLSYRVKVSCLLHLSLFAEALELIIDNPKLSGNLQYEKAYCYYRLQQIEEAKDVLDKWKDNSFRKQELLYQILYRLDRFEEAYDIMVDVIKNSDDEMDEERQTNLSAIEAALKLNQSDKRVNHVTGDTYEMRYNHAVGLIGEGKISEAEALLNMAEKQATEFLQEDGASEEDIADELGLILTQKAYCMQLQGRVKEAMGIYTHVLKSKPKDVGLIAVASNNLICINKDQNIFDSKKRVKNMNQEDVLLKLNELQKRNMMLNQCLFYLYTQQVDLCVQHCRHLEEFFPVYAEDAMLINAALVAKTEGIPATRKLVAPYIKKNPESAILINLGLVQQSLKEGKPEDAIALLKEMGDDYYRPGIISALVTLYQSLGKTVEAGNVLKDAVDYYRKSGGNKENMTMLWRQTASFMMEQGDAKEAAKSLEELLRCTPNDPVTLAHLIVAYSQHDIVKARSLSKKLPALAQPDVEVGVLESPNWLANVKLAKKAVKGDSVPGTPVRAKSAGTSERRGRSRKKRSKPSKSFDKDRQPDPERWVPRFERSGYRPKKSRKGRVDVGKGTQGADSVTSAMYDMSNKVGQKLEDSPVQPATWRKDAHKKKKSKKK